MTTTLLTGIRATGRHMALFASASECFVEIHIGGAGPGLFLVTVPGQCGNGILWWVGQRILSRFFKCIAVFRPGHTVSDSVFSVQLPSPNTSGSTAPDGAWKKLMHRSPVRRQRVVTA